MRPISFIDVRAPTLTLKSGASDLLLHIQVPAPFNEYHECWRSSRQPTNFNNSRTRLTSMSESTHAPTGQSSAFPCEIVDAIVEYLTVPELLIFAGNAPTFWRQVIENSSPIWKRIAAYPWLEYPKPKVDLRRTRSGQASSFAPWNFKYPLANGMLFVHRTECGTEAFLFAPLSEQATLRVLDPSKTTAKYNTQTRFGYGYIDLYDFDGNLVCSKQVSQNTKDAMWQYLTTFHGDEEKKHDMEGKDEPSVKRASLGERRS